MVFICRVLAASNTNKRYVSCLAVVFEERQRIRDSGHIIHSIFIDIL